MNDKLWHVYGLIDPRNKSVFYVGRSTNVDRRLLSHCSDPSSPAWAVCQVIKSSGLQISHCIFGTYLTKLGAKILEGRLILALPNLVNAKSFHALPSEAFYPDWQDLRVNH